MKKRPFALLLAVTLLGAVVSCQWFIEIGAPPSAPPSPPKGKAAVRSIPPLTPGEATLLAEPGFDLGKFTALSDEVVLGSFEKAESAYAVNGFGDQLIVTRVKLRVESAWKGKLAPRETVELEFPGGTVDGVTFVVHDGPTPTVPPEGRAVVFLARGAMGASVFGGSEGLLRVDTEGRVAGTELDVATLEKRIRAVAAGQVKR